MRVMSPPRSDAKASGISTFEAIWRASRARRIARGMKMARAPVLFMVAERMAVLPKSVAF